MAASSDAPHLPRPAPIEAYGKGGFAFADMSHRGSLLCLPDGIWAWPTTSPAEIDELRARFERGEKKASDLRFDLARTIARDFHGEAAADRTASFSIGLSAEERSS